MEMIHPTHDPRHMQVVVLDGDDFTIEEIVAVARYHAKVEFAPEFIERVNKSRAIIDRFVAEDRPVYGVTTGFGDNVTKRVTPEDAALLQLNIARSHAVSVGEPLKEEQVRAIQIAQINNSGRGVSGVSIELLEAIRDLLNHNVTPFVPGEGVVGALSTEGQTTLPLIGEGKAFYQGKLMSGAEALSAAGLKPYQLKSKEGLSLLNGTPGATGLACLATYDAMEATKASEIMAAFSYETNKGNIKHLDPRLHSVKNHSEQQESAENILNLLKGSEISQKYEGYRMQDAYSLRCVAQMMGGTKRAIKEAYISVTEELNSCSDNPVIYPTGDGDGVALMGGNFDRAYEGTLYEMIKHADVYKGIKGPSALNSRFLTEDIPYSLRAIQTLAQIANIPTPAIDTVVNLAYILLGDDLDEGRTLSQLGFNSSTTVSDLLELCR